MNGRDSGPGVKTPYHEPQLLPGAYPGYLGDILDQVENDYIVALDADHFSTRWFSRFTDQRGNIIENMLVERGMSCLNKRSENTTFSGARGFTNIDITLSNSDLTNRIQGWTVIPDQTSSDHRILRFTLRTTIAGFTNKPSRFDTKKADWQLFNCTLFQELERLGDTKDSYPEKHAVLLSTAFNRAAESAIQKRKTHRKITPPWWSQMLLEARRTLKRDARALRLDNCHAHRVAYNESRNRYVNIPRTEKRNTWRAFCTQGGHEPWGRLYKWLLSDKSKPVVPSSLVRPDGSRTRTMEETVEYMLNSLIPSDPNQAFPQRLPMQTPFECVLYTEEEFYDKLCRMAPNKAAGIDSLTVKMVKLASRLIAPHMVNLINKCLTQGHFPSLRA